MSKFKVGDIVRGIKADVEYGIWRISEITQQGCIYLEMLDHTEFDKHHSPWKTWGTDVDKIGNFLKRGTDWCGCLELIEHPNKLYLDNYIVSWGDTTASNCTLSNGATTDTAIYLQAFTTNNNKTNNNNNNMNLIQKFKLNLKSEPEKTLIKTGIMNQDETLTCEGKDLFFEWLFQANKEKFTEEVASKLLEEQKRDEK